ncbi:hypothetical protein CLTEP_14660 [Clostridium tepidiprofundi DSM 19306]|uniref:Uncharacterized protein n=1 Tax=Clostridium tepidiprofundi DSM 19306 TaxID=1121338 RepID=A0A151B3P3_9CLOT|nr:hypothetical protein [Clostridium tepidiprofundi]KYH34538.1 hypothetical protein CLTEP_14660 [Clostridium tepidiprofundi DSM 19306]
MTKKKIFIITLFIIVISFLLFIKFMYKHPEIPKLTVTYKEKSLKVGQGSYTWRNGFKTKEFIVDNYANIIVELMPYSNVSSNSNLQLHFNYQPENITLTGGYTSDNSPTIKNNIITIPEKEGTQIYFLDCKWKEGNVTYVIAIHVRN